MDEIHSPGSEWIVAMTLRCGSVDVRSAQQKAAKELLCTTWRLQLMMIGPAQNVLSRQKGLHCSLQHVVDKSGTPSSSYLRGTLRCLLHAVSEPWMTPTVCATCLWSAFLQSSASSPFLTLFATLRMFVDCAGKPCNIQCAGPASISSTRMSMSPSTLSNAHTQLFLVHGHV